MLPVAFPRPRVKLSDSVVSDTKHSPPVTTPQGPDDADEATGPASTGAQWPLPEDAFWSEKTDPHGAGPSETDQEEPEEPDEADVTVAAAEADEALAGETPLAA